MRDRKRPCFWSFWINSRISAGGKTAFFTLFPAPLLCYDGTQQGNEDLEGFALKLLHAGQCVASQSHATRARISFRHLWKRAWSTHLNFVSTTHLRGGRRAKGGTPLQECWRQRPQEPSLIILSEKRAEKKPFPAGSQLFATERMYSYVSYCKQKRAQ